MSRAKNSNKVVFCLQNGPSFGKGQLLIAPKLANQNKKRKKLPSDPGVKTSTKFRALRMLCNKLLSNLPASKRSTSKKTDKFRISKWTLRSEANCDPLDLR